MDLLYINETYCSKPEDFKSHLSDISNQKNKKFRDEVLAFFRDGALEEWYETHGVKLNFPDKNGTDDVCFKSLVKMITGVSISGNISSQFNEIGELIRVESDGKTYLNANGKPIYVSLDRKAQLHRLKVVFKCIKPENNDYVISLGSQSVSKNWKDFNRSQEVVYEFDVKNKGSYRLTEGDDNLICEVKIDDHEYVDLGLPSGLKWATCNIGAEKPERYGDYFAWGEIKTPPSDEYSANNCKTSETSLSDLKKNKVVDSNGNLTKEFDVATQKWGDEWRMPSDGDFFELIHNCAWNWVKQNGVEGYKVTGKNGNSIFLPAAGERNHTIFNRVGSGGSYWSSSVYANNNYACYLNFNTSGGQLRDKFNRYFGRTVRPVRPVSE